MRKWPDDLIPGHLGSLSCEDVSGESGLTKMGHGIPEVRVAWGRASPRSELRGCRRRKRLSSGHLGTRSCEDASGDSDLTNTGQGVSEVRVARMSHAKVT